MLIGAVLCWTAWVLVLVNIDPFQDNGVGLSFFYGSLFLAFLGTISLSSFLIHYYFSKLDLPLFRFVQKSFREALFISAILIVLLFLQGKNYLQWWNLAVGLIAVLLFITFRFVNKRSAETII